MRENKTVILALFVGLALMAGYVSAETSDLHSSLPLEKWPTNAKVDREVDQLVEEMDKMSRETVELEGLPVAFDNLCNGILKIGIPGLPETIKQIENRDRDWKARLTLISLIPYLRDIDSVKGAIIQPLANILLDKSDDIMVRTAVCTYGFSKLKDTTATEALIETMEDKSNPKELRYSAAHSFVFLHDERAVQPLLNVVDSDSSTDVRKIAIAALGAIGRETSNREMVQPLLAIAKDSGNPVRTNAVSALGVLKAEEALPLILEIAQGKQGYDRYVAIWALGNIGGEEAKEVLFDIARNDRDEWVKVDAIKALIDMGDESIIEQIQDAINSVNNPGGKKVLLDKFSKKFSEKK